MAYSEKVMDHFQHPRNVGEIENASGVGTVGNAKCGDIMRIFLDIDDETHIIKDCKFKTFGCGAAVATSSMATEMVKGKSIQEAMEVTNKAVMEALDGLPPVKVHCSLLAEEAIHAALWDYAEKHGIKIEGLKKPKSDIHEGEEAEEEEDVIDIEAKPEITFDDFEKLQFQVGEIIACEEVKKSRKLLCSQVKVGSQVKQIVSGIKAHYTPEEMVGKKVMVLVNLKPAKLAGVLSEGMLLCAEDAEGNLALMTPEKEMPAGAEIC